jgi:hypothetical protein
MILQISFMLIYRIVLETSGASNFRIAELHWRDFAVFVSLSSRTNTRQGLSACATLPADAGCARAVLRSFFEGEASGACSSVG